ncbi:class I SAM-dependent methyltransferase [Novosphingobium lentum]|uniref:class I SAM-dependent methyltransferase n=1 Tax=Novosphingobium lentum TaxID=145287 RepID=UPI00082C458B|nr:class I SAM-dependent methyltransferase [Novosphingobium lentum]
MGFKAWYDAHVMPRMIRCACSAPGIMDRRASVVPLASGRVFELGCGGGINQAFYDTDRVTAFAGIDPSPKLLDYAREQARTKGWDADIRQGFGEDIPFGDERFDTVVCTYTLCSVDDPARVLAELRRVLVPGGTLLFLEHGHSPDAGVARWQQRIEPMWKPMMGGCHLTRPIGPAVRAAGFSVEPIGSGYMPRMPRWASWMEWGAAVRA